MPITITNNNAYTAIPAGKKVSKNSGDSKSVLDGCNAVLNNNTPSLTQSSYIRNFRSMTFKFKECLRRENGEKQRSGMLVYLTKTLAEKKSESSIDLNSFHRAMQLGSKSCLKESHLGNNLVVLPVLLGSSLEKKKAVEKEFCSTVTEFVKKPNDKGKTENIYASVERLMKGNGFIGEDAKSSLDDFCIHYMGTSVYPRIIEEVDKVIELTETERQELKNNPEKVTGYLYSGENAKKDKIIELLKNQFIDARGSNEKAFKLRLLINAMESKITLIKPLRGIHNDEPQPSTSTVRQGPTPKPVKDPNSDVPHHYPSVINNNNNNNIIDLAPVMDLVRDLIKKSNSDSNDTSVKKIPTDIHLTDLMTGLKNAKSQIAFLNSKVASWQTATIPRVPQEVIDPIISEIPAMGMTAESGVVSVPAAQQGVINTEVPAMPTAVRTATVMTAESRVVSVPAAQQGVIGTVVPAMPITARAATVMMAESGVVSVPAAQQGVISTGVPAMPAAARAATVMTAESGVVSVPAAQQSVISTGVPALPAAARAATVMTAESRVVSVPAAQQSVISTGIPAMPAVARAATVMTAESGGVSVPAAQQGVISTVVPAMPTAARAATVMRAENGVVSVPAAQQSVISTVVPAMPTAARAATVMMAESRVVSVPAAQQSVISTGIPAMPITARDDEDEIDGSIGESSGYGSDLSASIGELSTATESSEDNQSRLSDVVEEQINRKSNNSVGAELNPLVSAQTKSNSIPVVTGLNPPVARLNKHGSYYLGTTPRASDFVSPRPEGPSPVTLTRGAQVPDLAAKQRYQGSDELLKTMVTGLNPPAYPLNTQGTYYVGAGLDKSAFPQPKPMEKPPVTLTRGAQVLGLAAKQRYLSSDELSKTLVTGLNPPAYPLNTQGTYYVGAGLDKSAFPQLKPKEKPPVTLTRGAQVRDLAGKYDYQLSDKRFGQKQK